MRRYDYIKATVIVNGVCNLIFRKVYSACNNNFSFFLILQNGHFSDSRKKLISFERNCFFILFSAQKTQLSKIRSYNICPPRKADYSLYAFIIVALINLTVVSHNRVNSNNSTLFSESINKLIYNFSLLAVGNKARKNTVKFSTKLFPFFNARHHVVCAVSAIKAVISRLIGKHTCHKRTALHT